MMPPRRGKFYKHAAKGRGRAQKQASATPSPPPLLNPSEDEGDEPLDLVVKQERTQSQERVEKQQSREHAEMPEIEEHTKKQQSMECAETPQIEQSSDQLVRGYHQTYLEAFS